LRGNFSGKKREKGNGRKSRKRLEAKDVEVASNRTKKKKKKVKIITGKITDEGKTKEKNKNLGGGEGKKSERGGQRYKKFRSGDRDLINKKKSGTEKHGPIGGGGNADGCQSKQDLK